MVNIYIIHTQHKHIHTYVFFFVIVAESLAMDGICFDFEIPCLFDLVPFQFKIKKKNQEGKFPSHLIVYKVRFNYCNLHLKLT